MLSACSRSHDTIKGDTIRYVQQKYTIQKQTKTNRLGFLISITHKKYCIRTVFDPRSRNQKKNRHRVNHCWQFFSVHLSFLKYLYLTDYRIVSCPIVFYPIVLFDLSSVCCCCQCQCHHYHHRKWGNGSRGGGRTKGRRRRRRRRRIKRRKQCCNQIRYRIEITEEDQTMSIRYVTIE